MPRSWMACRSRACAHWEAQQIDLGWGWPPLRVAALPIGLCFNSKRRTAPSTPYHTHLLRGTRSRPPDRSGFRDQVTRARHVGRAGADLQRAAEAQGGGPAAFRAGRRRGRGVRGPRSKEGGCFCLPRLTSARSLPPTMAAMERPPPPSPLLLPPSPDCCAVPATDNGSNGVPPPSPSLLPLPASHLTAARSLLPTMAAMERSPGSLRAPGAGWVTSAPKIMKWSMLPSCAGGCGGG